MPAAKREAVDWLQAHYDISERRGCQAINFCRGSQRYITKRDDKIPLTMRILDIAQACGMDIRGYMYCLGVKDGR